MEHSLAYFQTADFPESTAPVDSVFSNVSVCRYEEYRNPPNHDLEYKRPLIYWHVLAARLAFIVVYQNLVGFVMTLVEWTIPDVSRKLNDRIKREAYKVNEAVIKYETERAKERKNWRENRNRESVLSSDTVYADANGDLPSRRGTIYHDFEDS